MREKLIALIEQAKYCSPEELADYLIAAGLTVGDKWVPTAERLPERGTEVIVCSHRMILPVVFTTNFWDAKHDNWLGITHWMPLPEPPKEV